MKITRSQMTRATAHITAPVITDVERKAACGEFARLEKAGFDGIETVEHTQPADPTCCYELFCDACECAPCGAATEGIISITAYK